MSYFFSAEARIEHLEHVAYYEGQKSGLGARYLSAFATAMATVCENPERFRIELAPGIRRCLVPGFPYSILYRQSAGDVEVLAVAAQRRRPGYWLGRL